MASSTLIMAAAALALPAAAQAGPSPFAAEAARLCPAQHLGQIPALDLGRRMQAFEARLPEAQRRTVQDAVGKRCALIEGGDTCANHAGLDAYRRLGVLKAFVAEACGKAQP